MEKGKILKIFNELGYLLEPKLFEYFEKNENKMKAVLEKIKEKPPKLKILTLEFVNSILKGKIEIKILKEVKEEAELSVNNLLNKLSSRYEKIRKILVNRMDLINLTSINKISSKTKKFSIIGMVLEKYLNRNSILVEDLTGQLEIFVKKGFELIIEDEVIGIVCRRAGDKIYAERIVFPDIPLTRTITSSKKECFLIFSFSTFIKNRLEKFLEYLSEKNSVLFVFDKIDEKIAKEISEFSELISLFPLPEGKKVSDPSLLEIEGVKIFFSSGNFLKKYEEELDLDKIRTIVELVKKRHLNPKVESDFKEEIYYLDPIPDIIAVASSKTDFMNYKGISIITCSPEEPAQINLRTREISKVSI